MKQCPKCNSSCNDGDIICSNCGYLFNPMDSDNCPKDDTYAQNPEQNDVQINKQNQPPIANGQYNDVNSSNQQNGNNYKPTFPNEQNGNFEKQPFPGAPGQNPYYQGHENIDEPRTNGMSIASLVLGIIGVVMDCCYGFGLILGIIGLVLGILSNGQIKKSDGKEKGSGMAIAGIILSAIAILIGIIFIGYIIANRGEITQFMQKYMEYAQNQSSSSL